MTYKLIFRRVSGPIRERLETNLETLDEARAEVQHCEFLYKKSDLEDIEIWKLVERHPNIKRRTFFQRLS